MRRPRALLAGTAGAATLMFIAYAVSGTAATPGGDVHYFEARVVSSGSATADYGEERKQPGQITASGVDGKESLEWRWEVRAVAQSTGAGPLVTRAKAARQRAELTASVVSYGIQNGVLGESSLCDQRMGTTTFVSNDGVAPTAKKSGSGELVHDAYFRLSQGELDVYPPGGSSSRSCIHSATEGGLDFVEGVSEDDAPVPRGAFNPRSDRSYERIYRSAVNLDRAHYGDPNAAHTFAAQSQLEVGFAAISERRFNKLVRKYQNVPVHRRDESGETEYHEPPG